ncbi:MAG: hypothetical protein LUO93_03160 [Methanomicrobiales archaeon]|nr:hypothetical protein [Methanomicrobiales archaeon]
MRLTGTDDIGYLMKKISSSELDYGESWETELSIFIQKHPELSHSITL